MQRLKTTRPAVSLATLITVLIPLTTTNAGFVGYNPTDNVGYGMLAQASYWNWTGQTFANGWTLARYSGTGNHMCDGYILGQDGGAGYQNDPYPTTFYSNYNLVEYYWSGYFHYGSCQMIDFEDGFVGNYALAEVD